MSSATATPTAPRIHRIGAVTILEPKGSLAGDAATAFAETLVLEEGRSLGRLVVDLQTVTTLDSLGLETLVDSAHRLEDGGVALRLCGVSSTLLTVLEITGHLDTFDRHPDADEAARSFL